MKQALWRSTILLVEPEQIAGFTCDRDSVTEWLHTKALSARPHVATKLYLDSAGAVMGFAASTQVVVDVEDGTSAQRAGSREGRSVGYLLAQMAVRSGLSRQGIGSAILRDAMVSAARAYAESPFPLFVVDAADESLIEYYAAKGLRRLSNQLRLATPMRQIVRLLGDGASAQE